MTNWRESTLGDVVLEMRNGVNCKQDKSGIGDKITRIETISDTTFNLERVGFSKLSDNEKEKYKLARGDILFSHINSVVHVGKTALLDQNCEIYHGVNLMLFRPHNFISPKFLQYYLKMIFQAGYWRTLCKQSVNQASVNQTDIKKVPIKYPPLPEQKRIVAILDEAFAGIDQAIANTEKNLASARELFERTLNTIFMQKGEGWVTKGIDDVTIPSGTVDPTKTPDKFFQYVDVSGVSNKTFEITEVTEMAGRDAPSRARRLIKTNDVLFATIRPTLKRIASVPDDLNGQVCSTGYFVFRTNPELDSRFLFYHLFSDEFMRSMESLQSGASYPAVNDKQVKQQIISFPAPAEQKRIVGLLDMLRKESQHLETIYKQKLNSLNQLKQSLLQKAFSGELTLDKLAEAAE